MIILKANLIKISDNQEKTTLTFFAQNLTIPSGVLKS